MVTGWIEKFKTVEGLSVDFIVKKPFNLSEIARNINDMIGLQEKIPNVG